MRPYILCLFSACLFTVASFSQSEHEELFLLPALPDAWKTGAVKGLRARGDFEVNESWANNKLTKATIVSLHGNNCYIRSRVPLFVHSLKIHVVKSSAGYTLSFKTVKGKMYEPEAEE